MPRLRLAPLLLWAGAWQLWPQSFTPAERQADLSYIATQLPKLDPFFFAELNPGDFNAAVSQLSSQISTLTDAEFYAGLAALVAMAGDPHANLQLNNTAAWAIGFQQFPLTFRWLDDGVFVTSASTDYSQALGMQLVAIGDSSIDEVLAKLATIIPHANMQWVQYWGEGYLRSQQILQGLDIVPATPTSGLTFQDRAGNQFTLEVGALPAGTSSAVLSPIPDPSQGPLPLYLQQTTSNYWYTYAAPLKLLYVKYNICEDAPGYPFSAFAADVLAAFDANPVDTLVIDLRSNTGGNSALINPLIGGINQRLRTILANPDFRIYDVIDKGSFSSGSLDAMALKASIQATAAGGANPLVVIGEPTGGATSGPGDVIGFTLPSSKLNGEYPTQMIQGPAGIPPGPAFLPDVPVPTRSADYFARYDPVLGAMLARWPGPATAPSGNVITVNGANFKAEEGISAGSLAAGFGAFSAIPDGVQVNGAPGQVLTASGSQVNFVAPEEAAPGPATVSIQVGGTEIARGQVTVTAASPGVFVLQPLDPTQPGAVENEDFTVNSSGNPATKGSVVQIFATGAPYGSGGLDSTQQVPVDVLIGETPATVLYSAAVPQLPGLWQINAQVPQAISGEAALFLIAGHTASNGVTIWVK